MKKNKEEFIIKCKTNFSEKGRPFKGKDVSKENYKMWVADANVMFRDALLASKYGLSLPRRAEITHGAIERMLKAMIVKEYGKEIPVHEVAKLYDVIKSDLARELNEIDYKSLRLLDSMYISDRYPRKGRVYKEYLIELGVQALLNLKTIIDESLGLSKRAQLYCNTLSIVSPSL